MIQHFSPSAKEIVCAVRGATGGINFIAKS
jgi:hypothetical protein